MQSKKIKRDTITITVSGSTGSGKSTIAEKIRRLFDEEGITSEVIDDGDVSWTTMDLGRRIKDIIKKTNIVIDTRRVVRLTNDEWKAEYEQKFDDSNLGQSWKPDYNKLKYLIKK